MLSTIVAVVYLVQCVRNVIPRLFKFSSEGEFLAYLTVGIIVALLPRILRKQVAERHIVL